MWPGYDVSRRMEVKRQRDVERPVKGRGWLKIHAAPFGGGENVPAERRLSVSINTPSV